MRLSFLCFTLVVFFPCRLLVGQEQNVEIFDKSYWERLFSDLSRFRCFSVKEHDIGVEPATISSVYSDGSATISEVNRTGGDVARWIVNSKYVAKIEKSKDGNWALVEIGPPGSDLYKRVSNGLSLDNRLFPPPIRKRLEMARFSQMRHSKESQQTRVVYPYRETESEDSPILQLAVGFESYSLGFRPVKFEFPENATIHNRVKIDYDAESLFPKQMELVGETSGQSMTKSYFFELLPEKLFNVKECYLSFYGLREPDFAGTTRSIFLLRVVGIGLFAGAIFVFVLWRFGKRALPAFECE